MKVMKTLCRIFLLNEYGDEMSKFDKYSDTKV